MKKVLWIYLCITLAVLLLYAGCRQKTEKMSVLGVWGGSELDVFNEIISTFEKANKIKVEFEATRDINAVLTSRVEAGNPPDIAILPQLSLVVNLAKRNSLKELSSLIDTESVRTNYSQSWIDLGSVDGKFYGLFFKTAVKGLVYYNPKQFTALNLSVPKTWEELIQNSEKIAAMGKIPWSIGIESGDASGWPATDWIENIFVRLYGADKYRSWYEGKLAWTSPEVKRAFQMFGQIACNDKMVFGGRDGVVSTAFQDAGIPVFSSTPGAYMLQQASFMTGIIRNAFPEIKPIEELNFFVLPPINEQYSAVEIGGDAIVAFKENQAVTSFLGYLASSEAQAYFAKTGATMPNKNVPKSAYTSEIDRAFAEILASANTVVFDASDMMPGQVNSAFWSATIDYVKNPAKIDDILAQLEKTRMDAASK